VTAPRDGHAPDGLLRVRPREGHRIWAATYDEEPNPLILLEARTLPAMLGDLAGKTFLDAGCGTGRWAAAAAAGGARVAAVDLSREMLAIAAMKAGLQGRLVLSDVGRMPFKAGWADVTVCSLCLGYLERPAEAVGEMRRLARPGSRMILSDLHPLAAAAGWQRAFRRGRQVVRIESCPHPVDEVLRLGRDAGWELEEIREPRFGAPERELFRAAGKKDAFEPLASIPALLITGWRRP